MLSVYTRHLPDCNRTDIHDRRCRCPKWIRGKIGNEPVIRKSANTTSWEQAEQLARQWEDQALNPSAQRTTIEDALGKFVAHKEGQRVSAAWLYKIHRLRDELLAFAREKGFIYIDQLTADELTGWRATWKLAPITSSKQQERLRQFFKYCVDCDWLKKNPAKAMGRIIVRQKPTDYFTRDEYRQILAVTHDETGWQRGTHPYQRTRLRALVELMRYSGLRITDAVTLERTRLLDDGRLFLYQQKTGLPVYVPLPPHVVKQLNELKSENAKYFFWSGVGERTRACNPWEASLKLLFSRAKLGKRAHPHMFRDTFAVELLLAGVPIDQVSLLLGHSSVKVTEKHYAPFVKARQEQIAANAMMGWPEPVTVA